MKEVILNKPFVSEEEYFVFEERSEVKHEYINSTLFEMSGVSRYHNKIARKVADIIEQQTKADLFEVFGDGYKVRTPDGNFFYPDVILSESNAKRYYADRPVLLAEILSDTTRTFDLTDKFIQYRKFESLQYYMCIEPEQVRVHLYHRAEAGAVEDPEEEYAEWQTEVYTAINDTVNLPKLGISFSLKDIYQA